MHKDDFRRFQKKEKQERKSYALHIVFTFVNLSCYTVRSLPKCQYFYPCRVTDAFMLNKIRVCGQIDFRDDACLFLKSKRLSLGKKGRPFERLVEPHLLRALCSFRNLYINI